MAPAKPNRAQRRAAGRGKPPQAPVRPVAGDSGHHRRCPFNPARYTLLQVADRKRYFCTCWWDQQHA